MGLPEWGSYDTNRIIRAINAGKKNPIPEKKGSQEVYDEILAEKKMLEKKYPDQPCIFSLVEPDLEEEAMMDALMPDGWEDEIDALREAKEKKAKGGKK